MKKKSLIILFTLSLILLIHTVSFAENNMMQDMKHTTNTMKQEMKNEGAMLSNTVQDGLNAVENGARNIGNGIENVGEKISNTYEASRTSTQDMQGTTMNSYVPWLVIGGAFAVIIGLTWYYLAQTNREHD